MIVSITGHRPEKISDPEWVEQALTDVLLTLQPAHLIQGMAAGVDLMSAVTAMKLGIPFTSARPWAGHTPRNDDWQLYQDVTAASAAVVNVDPGLSYRSPAVYQRRNEYMVDHSDVLIAVWDGTKGGTRNCVFYAEEQGKQVVRINPKKRTVAYPEQLQEQFPPLDQLF